MAESHGNGGGLHKQTDVEHEGLAPWGAVLQHKLGVLLVILLAILLRTANLQQHMCLRVDASGNGSIMINAGLGSYDTWPNGAKASGVRSSTLMWHVLTRSCTTTAAAGMATCSRCPEQHPQDICEAVCTQQPGFSHRRPVPTILFFRRSANAGAHNSRLSLRLL